MNVDGKKGKPVEAIRKYTAQRTGIEEVICNKGLFENN